MGPRPPRHARRGGPPSSVAITAVQKGSAEMADGDPLIIGQPNTSTLPGAETTLTRNQTTAETVFVARNVDAGDGILGDAGAGAIGVHGMSASGFGVRGSSTW